MPQRGEGLRLVFRLLAILAVVLIPFGIYSYLYFDRQYDYHVNRNFRVLTEARGHLNALLRQFESFFNFDPYNEIKEKGYPIRAIVEERFASKKGQDVVKEFLEALEDFESEGDKGQEREITKVTKAFEIELKEKKYPNLQKESVEALRAVLEVVLDEGEQEREITKVNEAFKTVLATLNEREEAVKVFRAMLQKVLNKTEVVKAFETALEKEHRESQGKSVKAFRAVLKDVRGEIGQKEEIKEDIKTFETALEKKEDHEPQGESEKAFRTVLGVVLDEIGQGEAIDQAGRAFRAVLEAMWDEKEKKGKIEEATKAFKTALERKEDRKSQGKSVEAFRAVLKDVLNEIEQNRKIKTFMSALKDALDKEKERDLLEKAVLEESVQDIVEQIAKSTKTGLGTALGRVLQFEENKGDNLVDALPVPVLGLIRTALREARKNAKDAWKKVAKTQKEALIEFTEDRTLGDYQEDGSEESRLYLDAQRRRQSEVLSNKTKFFKENPAYKSLAISPLDEDGLCKQAALKEPLGLQIGTSQAQTPLSVLACQQERAKFAGDFEAKLSLAALMRDTGAEARNFDLLILAQEDGTVIYSSAAAPLAGIPKSAFAKFSNLKPFFQQDQEEATLNETTPQDSQSSIPLLSIIQEAKNGQVSIPLASLIREAKDAQVSIPLASVIREAEIAGTTYLLFLQPFQPPFPIVSQSDDDRPVWYLGGIIRKGEFQKKSLAVPLTVTGLAVLGLILGILSLPYIKLFFMNAGEPLKVTDIFFLVVSLVLGSGLITLLLLNTVAYHNMRAQFDTTAEDIKKRIKDEFRGELEETLKDLSKESEKIWPEKENKDLELLPDRYPPYESVFLVEGHGGLELAHWTTFGPRKPTQNVNISGRNYFLRARDKQGLWMREGYPEFFIERVHSYTDGVKISVVSVPCEEIQQREKADSPDCVAEAVSSRTDGEKDSTASENETFAVAALAKRFLSFRALALPPNFGFSVIEDNTGKVIFHSDDQRSLIENFFWETDNNLALQAAVHARQGCKLGQAREDCKIAGLYNGRKHHFFVTPLDESVPWSLVVFYDTRLLETVNFEIGVVAAGMFFLYVVIFVLGIAAIHLFVPGKHWSWCWPQSKSQGLYIYVTVPLVFVILSYWLGIWLQEGLSLLLLVVSLLLFVLGLLYLCFNLKRLDGSQEWKRDVAGLILLFGTVGGVSLGWVLNLEIADGGPKTSGSFGYFFLAAMSIAYLTSVNYLIEVTSVLGERGKFSRSHTSKSYPRFWYLGTAFLSVFVISILPSAAIFKDAFLTQSERFTEFRESEFVTDLESREKTLRDDIYSLAEPSEVSTVNEITASDEFFKQATKPGLYEYRGDCLGKTSQNTPCEGKARDSNRNGHLSESFIGFLPVYNKLAGKLRYSVSEQAGLSQSEGRVKIQYQALPSPPAFLPRQDLESVYRIAIYLCIILFLIVLFLLIRALAKRTVGLYLSDFEVLERDSEGTTIHKQALPDGLDKTTTEDWSREWTDAKGEIEKNRRILIRAPRALISKLEVEHADPSESKIVDLSSPILPLLGELRGWSPALPQKKILVTNFEVGLLEPRLRFALLEALERVRAEVPVILCSSVSPLHHLVTPEAYPEFDEGIQDAVPKADEKFRWGVLLSTFRKERFWYEAADWRKKETLSLATLSRECCWTDELISIYEDLENKVEDLTEEQIIHQVGDRAGAFYRKLWMLCTKEERLVLIHLAQGSLVNLKETEVLQRLLWRNLLRRDPDFRLPNESFANFVLTAEPPARIVEWEKGEADGSTWTMLRVPFILLLVLVAAFIARTGGEGVQAMTAIVSAVFAGLPILIQALSFLRGGQTDKLTVE